MYSLPPLNPKSKLWSGWVSYIKEHLYLSLSGSTMSVYCPKVDECLDTTNKISWQARINKKKRWQKVSNPGPLGRGATKTRTLNAAASVSDELLKQELSPKYSSSTSDMVKNEKSSFTWSSKKRWGLSRSGSAPPNRTTFSQTTLPQNFYLALVKMTKDQSSSDMSARKSGCSEPGKPNLNLTMPRPNSWVKFRYQKLWTIF